jgi:hypothetical protein
MYGKLEMYSALLRGIMTKSATEFRQCRTAILFPSR